MAGQPDLILQLAHRIADDYRALHGPGVAVYADAMVSLNGGINRSGSKYNDLILLRARLTRCL